MFPANSVMLEVWREACRHIEIQDFTQTAVKLLKKHLNFDAFLVRRIDEEHHALATIAHAMALSDSDVHVGEERKTLSNAELSRLRQWGKTGRILTRAKRETGIASLMIPSHVEGDVLIGPLVVDRKIVGVLILCGSLSRPLDRHSSDFLIRLLEPFAVAVENDRRIHEMASLREAAVADRGTLLRKLGRAELSDTIVGEDSGLKLVMERVQLVSKLDVPVLILGETGTGKEVVARAIHERSTRQGGPFIRINCGAIPPELIDSHLFGHEKGSFTGADQTRQGWFERAHGGTLFLDEIGELPLDAQVRLLRVLQDGFVERVGGHQSIHVDVRIVAATHRDLTQMVREGKFREDLWYRLAVFPIMIPPLRERTDDIPALAKHLVERAALRFGLIPVTPSPQDIQALQSYNWPGNIREMGAVIDRAAILGDGQALEIGIALGISRQSGLSKRSSTGRSNSQSGMPSSQRKLCSLDEAIREHIIAALSQTQGQVEGKKGAAHLLQINPHTLRAKMRKLNINWSDYRNPTDDSPTDCNER